MCVSLSVSCVMISLEVETNNPNGNSARPILLAIASAFPHLKQLGLGIVISRLQLNKLLTLFAISLHRILHY